MRTIQYRAGGDLHLAVVEDQAVADAIDVTAALRKMAPQADGLVAVIAHARQQGVSLREVIADLVDRSDDRLPFDGARGCIAGGGFESCPPVAAPEVWAAGVTYMRSREAREAESFHSADVYTRVYDAERPELFLKDAGPRRTVASEAPIAVRSDSSWSVPEPELALILDAGGRIVGITLGDDVTARDIEAANPLYLPQAKIYDGACALGPCALIWDGDAEPLPAFDIALRVRDRDGELLYEGAASTTTLYRTLEELVGYLRRDNTIPDGTVLMTGTGVVPPDGFRLEAGQHIEISSPLIGTLSNPVVRHGSAATVDGRGARRADAASLDGAA